MLLDSNFYPPVKPQQRLLGGTSKWTCFGDRLQAQLERWSLTNLTLLGTDLQTGEAALTRTTPRQTVAVIPRITMAMLRAVRLATPLELAAMRRGDFTVEALHQEQLANKRLADTTVDKTLLEIGLDRVLASLDRLTAPVTNGAVVPANDNKGNGGVAMPVQLSL
jgi:hypothetical protein